MDEDKEYLNILDLLYRIVEASKEKANKDEDLSKAQSLVRKFFCHCASVFYLARGTNIADFPSVKIEFPDGASVNVLARAAIESFLTFHYIFDTRAPEKEREFRLHSWLLGGLVETQGFPSQLPEGKRRLERERKLILGHVAVLKDNEAFSNLTNKQQDKILAGQWRTLSWREIARDAGLSDLHAKHFYAHLCGYAHSGSRSTLFIDRANTRDRQRGLFDVTLDVMKIAMSFFIFEYSSLFPDSKEELEKNRQAKDSADSWLDVGRGLREEEEEKEKEEDDL
jgi:hypothetical protein